MTEAAAVPPAGGSATRRGIAALPAGLKLGLMLLALHAAVAWDMGDWLSRAALLTHFGFFLLWQPVWSGERALAARHAVIVLLAGMLLVVSASWWLMTFWVAVLVALLGGSVLGTQARGQRRVYLLAALYLMALLLIWIVPRLLGEPLTGHLMIGVAQYGLPVLPVLAMLTRVDRSTQETALVIDFFSSLMLFLLVAALVLGSFVIKVLSQGNYAMALAQTLVAIALVLLVLGWLWSPRAGFTGFGQLLSRYLLSVGLPFETWLHKLADVAERESVPDEVVRLALEDIAHLPWVVGGKWATPSGSGEFGAASQHHAEVSFHDFSMVLYTRMPITPALLLHLKLLTQLLGYFYESKLREQTLRQHAYTQAIYETGARLTHDVKNILQSLTLLVNAAQHGADRGDALNALVQRQLPQITQRLQLTLEKLKAPRNEDLHPIALGDWWEALRARYAESGVHFTAEGEMGEVQVPAELFDSAAENLLQNALTKSKVEEGVAVSVHLQADPPTLTVTDSGSAVDPAVAGKLLAAPVSSKTGLGIGLYQVARQAGGAGYRLQLAVNSPGDVRFRLAPAA